MLKVGRESRIERNAFEFSDLRTKVLNLTLYPLTSLIYFLIINK